LKKIFSNIYFNYFIFLKSLICFLLSIYFPIIKIEQAYFFSKEVSLINSIYILFSEKLFFLSFLIFLFSIIFPLTKYIYIFIKLTKILSLDRKIINFLSNWSMVDVFVVSLVISIYKISLLSNIEVYYMFYIFIFSITTQLIHLKILK